MFPPLTGPVLTAAEMRAAEAAIMASGTSVDILMGRAGLALAEAVWRFGGGRPVLVLCGPGNNGGDGYVAARILQQRGLTVRVASLGPPQTDVARRAAQGWAGPVETLDDVASAPVLLDCLFGSGLSRALDDAVQAALLRLAGAARFVIAADLPSGVGTDDGAVLGAVGSNVTVALGALKPAHVLQPAAALCGHVLRADIGIPADSAVRLLSRPHLAAPTAIDHKYSRGLVAVIAGPMAGAAGLSAVAAARSGAGYVVLTDAGPAPSLPLSIVHRTLEEAIADPRLSAVVVGPGLGRDAAARRRLDMVMAAAAPLVLDADALHLIDAAALKARRFPVILTPHAGEFSALFPTLTGSKIDRARRAAEVTGATILFKGSDSVVAAPNGRVRVSAQAPTWLSTAGTGDVLAGITGAMVARGLAGLEAAEAALWLHSRAARLAGPALIADDLLPMLPLAVASAQ